MRHPLRAPENPEGVSLLRVSTLAQMETDYDPEGYSIPTQRKSVASASNTYGVPITKEFVEPGVSGLSMDKRPEIKRLLKYVKENVDITHVYVYSLSRWARNRIEDAIMSDLLEKLGVTLVSATERIDQTTPTGRALHGMMAVFNQLRSETDGEDIATKLVEKAERGGTTGLAPIGYLNVRFRLDDGRTVADVIHDPDRAHFIREIFALYATGFVGVKQLQRIMEARGLCTRRGPRTPSTPVSIHGICRILTNRYYIGYINHKGKEYKGRHTPIIKDLRLWDRVQRLLAARGGGTRNRVHDHFLKGSLWCERCECRLQLTPGKGNGGRYFYYFCLNRADEQSRCTLPYLSVSHIETAISDHWSAVTLPRDFVDEAIAATDAAHKQEKDANAEIRRQLRKRLAVLARKLKDQVGSLGNDDVPQDILRESIRQTRHDHTEVQRQLANISDTLTTSRAVLTVAAQMLRNPRRLYEAGSEAAKRMLVRTIFDRVYLNAADDGTGVQVVRHNVAGPFEPLIQAQRDWQPQQSHSPSRSAPRGPATARARYPLGQGVPGSCQALGSNKGTWVEVPGIEPGSSVASTGLLRAQSAVSLLGPVDHTDKFNMTGPVTVGFPVTPRDRECG